MTIDLSYPIRSGKEVAVITILSDNIQYEVEKAFTFIDHISPGNKKLILSKTYALTSLLKGVNGFTNFVNNDRVKKKNKLSGITEIMINSNELDNSDNFEDGRPSNTILTYHVTDDDDKDNTHFEPHTP